MGSGRHPGPVAAIAAVWGAAVALGCATPTIDGRAPDYDPTSLTGGTIYHFPLGQTLGVHVSPSSGGHDLDLAVREAIARWVPALGYRELRLRVVGDIGDADILVVDRATPLPVDTTACGATWTEAAGQTIFCPRGDTALTLPLVSGLPGRAKVLITIDVAGKNDASELLSVTVHEIGHALGIGGHSGVAASVMSAFPLITSPSPADARTLRYVLHRRPDLTL
jgi:predicted Zn-dependent protease